MGYNGDLLIAAIFVHLFDELSEFRVVTEAFKMDWILRGGEIIIKKNELLIKEYIIIIIYIIFISNISSKPKYKI